MPTRSPRHIADLVLDFADLPIPVEVLSVATPTNLPSTPVVLGADGEAEPVTLQVVTASGTVVDPRDVVGAVSVADNRRYLTREVLDAALGQSDRTPVRFCVSAVAASAEYAPLNRYVVRPRAGRGAPRTEATRAAFALLINSLREEDAVAIVIVTFEGTPRYAAIDCDGTLTTLAFAHERNSDAPLPGVVLDTALVREARRAVVRNMTNVAMPLVDTIGVSVRDYLASGVTEPIEAIPSTRTSALRDMDDLAARLLPTPEPTPEPVTARRRTPRVRVDNAVAPAEAWYAVAPTTSMTPDSHAVTLDGITHAYRTLSRNMGVAANNLTNYTISYNASDRLVSASLVDSLEFP